MKVGLEAAAAVLLLMMLASGRELHSPPTAPPPALSGQFSFNGWVMQYSPGMWFPTAGEGGWYFDFPVGPESEGAASVHYVVLQIWGSLAAKQNLRAEMRLVTSGNPTFQYRFNPDNTCDRAASARLYLQRLGDDLSGAGQFEFYRWWSRDPAFFELSSGGGDGALPVDLAPDKWISVQGRAGDTDDSSKAGFGAAISNLGAIGLTFGGGCFYGHGVNISGESARFVLTGFSAQ